MYFDRPAVCVSCTRHGFFDQAVCGRCQVRGLLHKAKHHRDISAALTVGRRHGLSEQDLDCMVRAALYGSAPGRMGSVDYDRMGAMHNAD